MDRRLGVLLRPFSGCSALEGRQLHRTERAAGGIWHGGLLLRQGNTDRHSRRDGGADYSLDYQSVSETWSMPVFTIILYYLLRTAVQSVSDVEGVGDDNRFWGV